MRMLSYRITRTTQQPNCQLRKHEQRAQPRSRLRHLPPRRRISLFLPRELLPFLSHLPSTSHLHGRRPPRPRMSRQKPPLPLRPPRRVPFSHLVHLRPRAPRQLSLPSPRSLVRPSLSFLWSRLCPRPRQAPRRPDPARRLILPARTGRRPWVRTRLLVLKWHLLRQRKSLPRHHSQTLLGPPQHHLLPRPRRHRGPTCLPRLHLLQGLLLRLVNLGRMAPQPRVPTLQTLAFLTLPSRTRAR